MRLPKAPSAQGRDEQSSAPRSRLRLRGTELPSDTLRGAGLPLRGPSRSLLWTPRFSSVRPCQPASAAGRQILPLLCIALR